MRGVPAILGLMFGMVGLARAADSFTVRADWFDRGNVVSGLPGESYATRWPAIWNGGKLPNRAEYDLDFPVAGTYAIWALYTAKDSRPVDILVDGQVAHRGLAGVTGSWSSDKAVWEKQVEVELTAGRHTVALVCPGPCICHISGLRFETAAVFPVDWRLDRAIGRAKSQDLPPPPLAPHRIPPLPQLAAPHAERIVRAVRPQVASVGNPERDELARLEFRLPAQPTPWQVEVRIPLGQGAPSAGQTNLGVDGIRTMIKHTGELLDDFSRLDPQRDSTAQRTALDTLRQRLPENDPPLEDGEAWQRLAEQFVAVADLQRAVALGNPLLDFDRLLLVRRSRKSRSLGLPQNWQSNCVLPRSGFDNEIATLSPVRPDGALATVYRPAEPRFVGDVDLHFSGDRLLFSSIGPQDRWHVFECNTDGSGLRQVTPVLPEVDQYDACYLPDGAIILGSTAPVAAVPCVNGSTNISNLYRLEPDGVTLRQLCFDQEHNWCPTMLPNGRVMYLRWEYTDTPHSHDRVLFQMNPDGTSQMEYYGSNSYWPNSLFYARPVPDAPGKFVGIVGGHHGVPRMGELVLFDVNRGRREAAGAVQRFPGRGLPVAPPEHDKYGSALIDDQLVDKSWPKYLHPYPLSESYILVACQPTPDALWGIYLADAHDNLLLLHEVPGESLLEPLPLRSTPTPPVIPARVDLSRQDGVVYLADVYRGDGLRGIPRDTVKSLRIFSYHFLYPKMGGPMGVVGMDGPWDIKRIVGTVPVREDGSALFRVPANTPLAVQPLDAEGKAVQLMRSWFTAMPGETLSCVGCHESQNSTPPAKATLAGLGMPDEIRPWYGETRGFNFAREVQPVLDAHCIRCHDGTERGGKHPADLRGGTKITDYRSVYHHGRQDAGHFTTSYAYLHRFVRRPGLESDYRLLAPMEFHADTTQLVQTLKLEHPEVQLDEESWSRLVTWIDLNAPFHGTWTEIAGAERVAPHAARRREFRRRFAGMDEDFEAIPPAAVIPVPTVAANPARPVAAPVACPGWPFSTDEAVRRQQAYGDTTKTIDLGDGLTLDLVLIPPGAFVMGDTEIGRRVVQVEQPFWLGRTEISNVLFERFDPSHDSGVESRHSMQFGVRGFYVNGPEQPVVRVTWEQAVAFCAWLRKTTGLPFALPGEAQWEYACRAGSAQAFSFGPLEADFTAHANLADRTLREFVTHPYRKQRTPYANPGPYDDWIPKDDSRDDGGFLADGLANYQPNPWGLHDMHGNVAEWTATAEGAKRIVRGGSWRDRPRQATASFRLAYHPYQPVFNVGFRVLLPAADLQPVHRRAAVAK
ncbi:MAG: SUMF1/EgtB/PvdO family nonheme iron enzyme [Lentisphaeria bacterium]|jgi:formylglycine-generating enzyme required for sulfatase activity|nr:SUMF1/EgtB/PvdO family nonheme iron enzyme [Lentisphaeria bacterium]